MKTQTVYFRRFQLIGILLFMALFSYGQETIAEKIQNENDNDFKFTGTIGLNTNGISPIPAFSLGKPAIMAFLSLYKNKFSFDPEIAYATDGKPWFFSSCFRYRILDKKRFGVKVAAVWNISHSYTEVIENGFSNTITKANKYLVFEFIPTFTFSDKFSIDGAVFFGRGFERDALKQMHFVTLVGKITKLRLSKKLYYSLFPQIFYLNLDGDTDSFFVSGIFGIGHQKLPLFLSTQMNQTVATSISPDPGFSWNVGLTYTF